MAGRLLHGTIGMLRSAQHDNAPPWSGLHKKLNCSKSARDTALSQLPCQNALFETTLANYKNRSAKSPLRAPVPSARRPATVSFPSLALDSRLHAAAIRRDLCNSLTSVSPLLCYLSVELDSGLVNTAHYP